MTRLARAAGVGPMPGVPSYRTVPLLHVRRLVCPATTPNPPPNRVAPAVWRRPAAHAGAIVRLAAPPSGESDRGARIVAMAPPSQARPAALPVTRIQRTPPTATPPRPRSVSAPPAFNTIGTAATPPSPTPPPKRDPLAGIEMDRLARQLFEPLSRLLRTDMRRGRERAGAAQDRRH
ncbi:MAG TPA: hypothetical protein VH352_05050 [Pseudonocardiaceae bacterium]|nr:hypothetical protein [Pseudonocardiaceae bacterium]